MICMTICFSKSFLVENYLEELEISRKDELKMQREKSKAKS